MKQVFTNKDSLGKLILISKEKQFEQRYFEQKPNFSFHTIAWNKGESQKVMIDEVYYTMNANTVLPIMLNQSFKFERPDDIIAWQFNREFYCILNHDAEVGCVGFLFFGPSPTMFINLDEESTLKMERIQDQFLEEFETDEDIKAEMLRVLLVRLIINLTRLAKKQYLGNREIVEEKFNLLRQFNLLVEIHFRKEHQVQFYAGLLNKSPKTISNTFSLYSKKSPQKIIQDRIITEAKRLFFYTDKQVKEIADDLGFEDVAHFSKFFKSCTSLNPSELKKTVKATE